ncbi:MAG: TonB-dependent receptor [Acidobacteriota bacterium]|nr:TonB-dependent receptor [Acidobacteriota bacterium]
MAGAEVVLSTAGEHELARGRTSRQGIWRIPASPGLQEAEGSASGWILTVRHKGFASAEVALGSSNDRETLRVELELATVSRRIVVTSTLPEMASEVALDSAMLTDQASFDLATSLRGQPGLDAFRRGPVNLDPTVRGLQETQVAMLVDGTRTFAAGPGRMDSEISHAAPHSVDEVVVVKGPYALTWGAGALSAVDVRTHSLGLPGNGAWTLRGGADYRSNVDAQSGHLSFAKAGAGSGFQLLGEYRTGGDYESGDGEEVPGDYESSNLRWSWDWKPGDPWLVKYSGGYQAQDDIDYPGRVLDATYFRTRSHDVKLTYASGAAVQEVFGQVYVNRKDHRMNNDEKPSAQPVPGRIPPFALRVDLPTESNTAGARLFTVLGTGDWSWRVGADGHVVEQTATRRIFRRDTDQLLFEDRAWPDSEGRALGAYGQGVLHRGSWQLGATVRVDDASYDAKELSEFYRTANGLGSEDPSWDDTSWSAAVSAERRLGERWLITAGIGRATRVPNSLELYADRFPSSRFQIGSEFVGNPRLEPESSLQVDLGAQTASPSGSFEIALFYRSMDDYITVQPDPNLPRRLPLSPQLVYRYINGDRAVFYGGEIRWRHQLGQHASWWTAAELVRGEDRTFDEPAFGQLPLSAQAGLRLDLGGVTASTRLANWWTSLETRWVDDQDRVATSRLERPTDGYTTVDLRLGGPLTDRLSLRGGIENLFDEAYTTHLNTLNPFTGAPVPEPGRSVYVGFEVGL